VTVAGVVLVSGDEIESARLDGTTLIDHAVSALRGSGVVDVVSVVRGPVVPVDGVLVVHRPEWALASADLVAAVVAAVLAGADVAVPAVEVTETVKEVDTAGRIVRTVPREDLVRLQYPRAGSLRPDGSIPPGARTVTVPGVPDAFPVRDGKDLQLAAAVLAARTSAAVQRGPGPAGR
jgi:2-C-methyl-D-erythritol 4-phosphate cytidylyltransferase